MQQLSLLAPAPVSAVSVTVSRTAWQSASNVIVCLGVVLPPDFHAPTAPVQVVSGSVCLPASLARVSVCLVQRERDHACATACSGGAWLWAFTDPVMATGEGWPLCSAHEAVVCHCVGCQTAISPYMPLHRCTTCMAKEHDDSTRFVELAEETPA